MSRLDQLLNLRDRIDAEIEREKRALARLARVRSQSVAVLATGGSWSERVIAAAARRFNLEPEDLDGATRGDVDVVRARHVAAWLLREAGRSYPEIGKALGRDHTTAINSVRRVEETPALMAVAVDLREGLLGQAGAA
jgi:chromosomal replication initiation ATPase DnaA